jgi:hypothetical protein
MQERVRVLLVACCLPMVYVIRRSRQLPPRFFDPPFASFVPHDIRCSRLLSKHLKARAELRSLMQKKQIPRRRRLTTSVRKRITSYYTETEQQEIATAAFARGVSLSSFIASAALKEARAVQSKRR